MKKFDKGNIIAAILYVGIFIASYYISLGIVRLYARTVEPNTLEWHDVFVSLSPRAEKYHRYSDCKFLNQTVYETDIISVSYAESLNRTPCRFCIEKYRKHQYDKYAWYLYTPILILLFILLAVFDSMSKKYELRSPIVKKTKGAAVIGDSPTTKTTL